MNVLQYFICTDIIKRVLFTLTREQEDKTSEEFKLQHNNFKYKQGIWCPLDKYSLCLTITLRRSKPRGYLIRVHEFLEYFTVGAKIQLHSYWKQALDYLQWKPEVVWQSYLYNTNIYGSPDLTILKFSLSNVNKINKLLLSIDVACWKETEVQIELEIGWVF